MNTTGRCAKSDTWDRNLCELYNGRCRKAGKQSPKKQSPKKQSPKKQSTQNKSPKKQSPKQSPKKNSPKRHRTRSCKMDAKFESKVCPIKKVTSPVDVLHGLYLDKNGNERISYNNQDYELTERTFINDGAFGSVNKLPFTC